MRIFIICLFLFAALLILFFIFLPPLLRKIHFRHFRKYMGRKIYKIAQDHDYCLIQDFTMQLDRQHTAHFDHILFGNKYFYCIVDKAWKGSVIGHVRDENWIFIHPRTKMKQSIKNPIRVNQLRMEKFSLLTGIDQEMLIDIVVVSDDCLFSCHGLRSESTYMVYASELKKLIDTIEHRDVPPFEDAAIEKVVSSVYQLQNK